MNAFTNADMTHYWTTVHSENLDAMLKIEAMRMFYAADLPPFGCSTLKESEFEREREVVRNEIRAGSSANIYVEQLIAAQLYPPHHAYSRETGGDDQQIASASLKDACEFMKKYYAPERATIVIAGNVDIAKTTELIKKWFGKIPKRAGRARGRAVCAQHAPRRSADVERPAVWIGQRCRQEHAGGQEQFGSMAARGSRRARVRFRLQVSRRAYGSSRRCSSRIELKGWTGRRGAHFAKNPAARPPRFDGFNRTS
jgi:predicted Zn-dependent peptidase